MGTNTFRTIYVLQYLGTFHSWIKHLYRIELLITNTRDTFVQNAMNTK